jgi:hypothetical protein
LEDPLVLQAVLSVHLPGEAGILPVDSVPVVATARLEGVASLGPAVAGAAEAAAKSLGSLGQKEGLWVLFFIFPNLTTTK